MSTSVVHDGAHVIAVDRNSGNLRWITEVESHPAAIITGSPVFNGTTVYVGVSSSEEGLATNPAYPCCTFRGSMVALDVFTGAILWKTYTAPDNGGVPDQYSGNAIWSPPAIDPGVGRLYIGTGNNYTVPDPVLQCQQQAIDNGSGGADCTAPDDYFNTVLSLDLETGAVKWARRVSQFDTWTWRACRTHRPELSLARGTGFRLSGLGSESAWRHRWHRAEERIYWALDADTGAIIWNTIVGPGGTTGGIQWGRPLTARESMWRSPTAHDGRTRSPTAARRSPGARGRR
jgi:polyvinyl alcohol dehydrogenase (cytochrome)